MRRAVSWGVPGRNTRSPAPNTTALGIGNAARRRSRAAGRPGTPSRSIDHRADSAPATWNGRRHSSTPAASSRGQVGPHCSVYSERTRPSERTARRSTVVRYGGRSSAEAGERAPGPVASASPSRNITPSTRSGASNAASATTAAPLECPTSSARRSPKASSTASSWRAWSASV